MYRYCKLFSIKFSSWVWQHGPDWFALCPVICLRVFVFWHIFTFLSTMFYLFIYCRVWLWASLCSYAVVHL